MDDELLAKLIRRLQQGRDKRQACLPQSPDRANLDKLIAEYEAGIERTELAHNLKAFYPPTTEEKATLQPRNTRKKLERRPRAPWLEA